MKAYIATSKDTDSHEIVFSESKFGAMVEAASMEIFEDVGFDEINIKHAPDFDKYYEKGRVSLDIDRVDVQREMRYSSYYNDECAPTCEECGLYEYEDLQESHLTSGVCVECKNTPELFAGTMDALDKLSVFK